MKQGILYGVSVGPGDLELITLKAVRTLQECDVIFTVVSRQSDSSVSKKVIDSLDDIKAECIELVFAMTKNWDDRMTLIKGNAQIVLKKLKEGKNCAFTTIGDALTYSTYGYLMKEIQKLSPETEIKTIPGVNSWSALAAETNTILVEDKEKLTIVPSYSDVLVYEALKNSETTVFLKTYNSKNSMMNKLNDFDGEILYGSNIGMNKEFISKNKKDIISQKNQYLSMLIVKNRRTLLEE